jgi:hypothetical protein
MRSEYLAQRYQVWLTRPRSFDVKFRTADDERVYVERMRSLIEPRTKLSMTPVRASEWVTVETDRTYREVWSTEGDGADSPPSPVMIAIHPIAVQPTVAVSI